MVSDSRLVLLVLGAQPARLCEALKQTAGTAWRSAEVVACTSADEVRARMDSGCRHSALLVTAAHPELDLELRAAAERSATPIIPIGTAGAADRLPATVDAVAAPVLRADRLPWALARLLTPAGSGCHRRAVPAPMEAGGGRGGRLIAVCGPGGTAASLIAAALADRLADEGLFGREVLLADLALRADQAHLHRIPHPPAGLLDLVAACRYQPVRPDRAADFCLRPRAYHLLAGLSRPSHWTAVGPRAFDAALWALRAGFGVVVADVTAEFDGEAEVGSTDVEERNHMARRAVSVADVVVVAGRAGWASSRRLTTTVDELLRRGVDPRRVQPVMQGLSQSHPALSELPVQPVWIAELDPEGPVPAGPELIGGLPAAVTRLLRCLPGPSTGHGPVLVAPGSVGHEAGHEAAGHEAGDHEAGNQEASDHEAGDW